MTTNFGLALKTMRMQLGLSQLELATAIDSTQRHVSFLETGRSQPSSSFVARLATGLSLSLGQRAALFDALGAANPYRRRDFDADQLRSVLDMLENRALRHWPFAGFVLDESWTVLRANPQGWALLQSLGQGHNAETSLFEVFLSDSFLTRVENWEEIALIFYFRMQKVASRSARLQQLFEEAKAQGRFAHLGDRLTGGAEVPPYIPAIFHGPDGQRLQMSSFVGRLASIHEAAIDGLEIELMVPVDEQTETCLLSQPTP